MAIVRAVDAFAYTDKQGIPRVVRPGDLFDSTDPCVSGREHLFESVEVSAERRRATVEDATAVPGAKRSVSTPRKKKAEPVGNGGTDSH